MSKLFYKDELPEVYKRYFTFDRFVKNLNVKMDDCIHKFEKHTSRITQKGYTTASCFCFQIIRFIWYRSKRSSDSGSRSRLLARIHYLIRGIPWSTSYTQPVMTGLCNKT